MKLAALAYRLQPHDQQSLIVVHRFTSQKFADAR
jgi:hypothetical protein